MFYSIQNNLKKQAQFPETLRIVSVRHNQNHPRRVFLGLFGQAQEDGQGG
jgi:hypothetical protein